jgi:Domain of unknown function (DUF397)
MHPGCAGKNRMRYDGRYLVQMQAQMHMQTLRARAAARATGNPRRARQGEAMNPISNGTPAGQLPVTRWQKSRRSNSQGNCVEVAPIPGGQVAVRNSRHPEGPALIYTRDEMVAFIEGAKDGDFDHLLG